MKRSGLFHAAVVAVLFSSGANPARSDDPVVPGAPPAPPAAPVDPKAKPFAFAESMVAALKIGPGIQSEQVILFPLYLDVAPEAIDVHPTGAGDGIAYEEPAKPRTKEGLLVKVGPKPTLLLGGTVLEGGFRDRMVIRDHIVAAGTTREVETLPASTSKGRRKSPAPFRLVAGLAPPYLREESTSSDARSLIPRFVSHFLEFRTDGDLRESLAAVASTERLGEFCVVCRRAMASWPKAVTGATVVGGIAVVRGRVQCLELYGTNDLLSAYFEPFLRSLSYSAAAVELRAAKAGVPIPGKDVPAKTLEKATVAANELFGRLRQARYNRDASDDAKGNDAFLVSLPEGAKGRAIGHQGRLVHLSVFPDDPFEYALYNQPLDPLSPEDAESNRAGPAELERREASGQRLTEAEKRLLERLRQRGR